MRSLLALVLLAPLLAGAQGKFPVKAGRVVVAYPPGGPTDILARLVAQKLTEHTAQQWIVDNRPGAAGVIEIGRAHV